MLCFMLLDIHRVYRFFFNDPPTTEIYTLSLHDALPIFARAIELIRPDLSRVSSPGVADGQDPALATRRGFCLDRKSTRLNSSHLGISYAVFCLKKKKK